ncbi:glycosyltransferase family 4 protein [Desulfonatronum sp. SC1]|uniref:MraY family glycosyltransferase n=1 Tax=Desulfonatronum sp. SC1 TaxID=2109626 RepID=UPI000D31C3CC|nr:glycosyltransferase family 4 protein [Desulfonatronum sp. SC1]PTN33319.1 UDP-phosphate N-acetylglucosaminyl 1-phosphate transferase [Desulfonatronum sp. SC1]
MSFGPGLSFLAPVFAALFSSAVLTAYLTSGRARLRILDHPNERSLHHTPVPRTGGLAILAGLAVGMIVALAMDVLALGASGEWETEMLIRGAFPELLWLVGGALLVAMVSFVDDRKGVGVVPRFAVHVAAAFVLLAGGLAPRALDLGVWVWAWPMSLGVLFSGLFMVWMTNLYNFMDGMDGFAGGMGLIGFGFLGLFGLLAGESGYALVCWSTALACLGFLVFNYPPARIFMGDTGASSLGFWAGALILWADGRGMFPFWAGVLVFSPFIVDATVTLLRRLLAGEKVWQAHRSHYYQRLVQLGWGHRKTVLAEYAVMLAAGLSGLFLLQLGNTVWVLPGLTCWTLIYLVLAMLVGRMERRLSSKNRAGIV